MPIFLLIGRVRGRRKLVELVRNLTPLLERLSPYVGKSRITQILWRIGKLLSTQSDQRRNVPSIVVNKDCCQRTALCVAISIEGAL